MEQDHASGRTLTIDGHTRIVPLDRLAGKHAVPIDFGRETILLVDPATLQPVAVCRPLSAMGIRAPDPSSRPAMTVPMKPNSGGGNGDGERLGRLTLDQRDDLAAMCRLDPTGAPDKIGEQFERKWGRSVSILTVKKYQDEAIGA